MNFSIYLIIIGFDAIKINCKKIKIPKYGLSKPTIIHLAYPRFHMNINLLADNDEHSCVILSHVSF